MDAPARPFQILFVCTGNTCRSPLAESLLRQLMAPALAEQVQVLSAGTHAEPGTPPTSQAVEAGRRRGLELGAHRARRLSHELIDQSDLVLGMEQHHVDAALGLERAGGDRCHLLSRFHAGAGQAAEPIHDPLGGSGETYDECLRRIEHHLRRILPALEERVAADRRAGGMFS